MTNRAPRPTSEMTHRWALAWMLVGLVALSYPLWRPAPRGHTSVEGHDWLRTGDSKIRPSSLAGSSTASQPAREARALPERPVVTPVTLPAPKTSLIDEADLVVDLAPLLEPPRAGPAEAGRASR